MDLFETAISQGIAPAIVVAIYLIVIKIIDTKKEFSAYKRAKSFVDAGRGIAVFLKTTPNAWIQLGVFLI